VTWVESSAHVFSLRTAPLHPSCFSIHGDIQPSLWNHTEMDVGADMLHIEKGFWSRGYSLVAGTDEVGRGCLAGPVVAAAVILPPEKEIKGVTDSKALSPVRRQKFFSVIRSQALAYSIVEVSPQEIDKINILQASLKAMTQALYSLKVRPDIVLIDGNQLLNIDIEQLAVVKGDARSQSIAAASILAKVHRDNLMEALDQKYPLYNFARNKGYGTAEHRHALKKYGPCPVHRKTFKGVQI